MSNSDKKTVGCLVAEARGAGHAALSEYASKRVLAAYGVPTVEEELAADVGAAVAAAERLGYPVAVKACAPDLAHKSEQGLVQLHLTDAARVEAGAAEMLAAAGACLVQRMAQGRREFIAGALRDPTFGPCVMLGLGGVAVEALGDVAFRLAPLDERDALEMIGELRAHRLFDAFRGEPAVDRAALVGLLDGLGRLLLDHPDIAQVDVNPLIIEAGRPVAVDALVTLAGATRGAGYGVQALACPDNNKRRPEGCTPYEPSSEGDTGGCSCTIDPARFRPLFEPESLAIVGVSDNPLKWGYRILFNTREGGYNGRLYGVNPNYQELMDVPCYPSVAELPEAVDLALVVVPPPAVPGVLRDCAAKGVPAALVITAGYGELGDAAAHEAEAEIAAIARETGMLVIGPNCAGLASPAPCSLYSGMISRFPSPGGLSIVTQSGNVGNTVLSWAGLHQVGVARFISTGNEAAVRNEDYLDFCGSDPRTRSVLSYIEGTRDGRRLVETLRRTTADTPVVVVKGGRSSAGMRAAQSHTGRIGDRGAPV